MRARPARTYDEPTWHQTGIRDHTNAVRYSYSYTGDAGKRGNITGRLAAYAEGPQTSSFGFDLAHRLTQLTITGTTTTNYSYTYDGHGRRTTTQVGAAPKTFNLYARNGQLLQVGATGAVGTERYVYLGQHLVAKLITGSGGSTTVRYQHTDSVGSPVAETDAAGTLIAGSRKLYEPYGLVSGGTPTQGPGFTGHVYDAHIALSYMQQRYHDPVTGRFLSVDPVPADPGSGANFNRYWYANNNPYKFTDPDGRKACGKNTTCSLEQGARGYSTAEIYGARGARGPRPAPTASTASPSNASDMNSASIPSNQSCGTGKAECYGPEVEQAKNIIEKYKIVGFGYLVCYSSCQKADGQVTPSGYVILGPSAYKTESWLAATLGHEIEVHWMRQMKVLGPWKDWAEYHSREREAYDYNIGTAWSFGNSDAEVVEFIRRRDAH